MENDQNDQLSFPSPSLSFLFSPFHSPLSSLLPLSLSLSFSEIPTAKSQIPKTEKPGNFFSTAGVWDIGTHVK